eukprot:403347706
MPKAEVKMIDLPRQQNQQHFQKSSHSALSQNKIIDYQQYSINQSNSQQHQINSNNNRTSFSQQQQQQKQSFQSKDLNSQSSNNLLLNSQQQQSLLKQSQLGNHHQSQQQLNLKNFIGKIQIPFTKSNIDEVSTHKQADIISQIIQRSEQQTDHRIVDNYEVDMFQLSNQNKYQSQPAQQPQHIPQQIHATSSLATNSKNEYYEHNENGSQISQLDHPNILKHPLKVPPNQFYSQRPSLSNNKNKYQPNTELMQLTQSQEFSNFKHKLINVGMNNNHHQAQLQFKVSPKNQNTLNSAQRQFFNQENVILSPMQQQQNQSSTNILMYNQFSPTQSSTKNFNSNMDVGGANSSQQFNMQSSQKNSLRKQFLEHSQMMIQNTNTTMPFTRKGSIVTVGSAKSGQRNNYFEDNQHQQQLIPQTSNGNSIDQIVETIYDSLDKLRSYLVMSIQDQEQKLRDEYNYKYDLLSQRIQELESKQSYTHHQHEGISNNLQSFNTLNLEKQQLMTFHTNPTIMTTNNQTQKNSQENLREQSSNAVESRIMKPKITHLISSGSKSTKTSQNRRPHSNLAQVIQNNFGISQQQSQNYQQSPRTTKRGVIGIAKTANQSGSKTRLMASDRKQSPDRNPLSAMSHRNTNNHQIQSPTSINQNGYTSKQRSPSNEKQQHYISSIQKSRKSNQKLQLPSTRISLATLNQQTDSVKSQGTQLDLLVSQQNPQNLNDDGSQAREASLQKQFNKHRSRKFTHNTDQSPEPDNLIVNMKEKLFQKRKKSRQSRVEIFCTDKNNQNNQASSRKKNAGSLTKRKIFIDLDDKTLIQSPNKLPNQDINHILSYDNSKEQIVSQKAARSQLSHIRDYQNAEMNSNVINSPQQNEVNMQQQTQSAIYLNSLLPVSIQPKSKVQLETYINQNSQGQKVTNHAVISIKRASLHTAMDHIVNSPIPSKKLPKNDSTILNKPEEYSEFLEGQANSHIQQNTTALLQDQSEQMIQLNLVQHSSRTNSSNELTSKHQQQIQQQNITHKKQININSQQYEKSELQLLQQKYVNNSRNTGNTVVQSPSNVINLNEMTQKQLPRHTKQLSSNYLSAQDSFHSLQSRESDQQFRNSVNNHHLTQNNNQNEGNVSNNAHQYQLTYNINNHNQSSRNMIRQEQSDVQVETLPMLSSRIANQIMHTDTDNKNEQIQHQNIKYFQNPLELLAKESSNHHMRGQSNSQNSINTQNHQQNKNHMPDIVIDYDYEEQTQNSHFDKQKVDNKIFMSHNKINQVKDFLNDLNDDLLNNYQQDSEYNGLNSNYSPATINNTNQKAFNFNLDLKNLKSVDMSNTPGGGFDNYDLVLDSDRINQHDFNNLRSNEQLRVQLNFGNENLHKFTQNSNQNTKQKFININDYQEMNSDCDVSSVQISSRLALRNDNNNDNNLQEAVSIQAIKLDIDDDIRSAPLTQRSEYEDYAI